MRKVALGFSIFGWILAFLYTSIAILNIVNSSTAPNQVK